LYFAAHAAAASCWRSRCRSWGCAPRLCIRVLGWGLGKAMLPRWEGDGWVIGGYPPAVEPAHRRFMVKHATPSAYMDVCPHSRSIWRLNRTTQSLSCLPWHVCDIMSWTRTAQVQSVCTAESGIHLVVAYARTSNAHQFGFLRRKGARRATGGPYILPL
jgi:hypothetical protein